MLLNILAEQFNIYSIIAACAVMLVLIWAFVVWLFTLIVGVDEDDETPASYYDWPEPDGPPLDD